VWHGLLFCLVLLGCSQAQAACGGTQPYVMCTDVLLTELYVETNGNVYIRVDGTQLAAPSCNLNGGYITLLGGSSRFNAVYATLLAAQSAGRRVLLRMGAETTCTLVYVMLAAP
jgi:hypothetical protein